MSNLDKLNQEGLDHLEAARIALETVESNLRAARDIVGDNFDLLDMCDELILKLYHQTKEIKADLPEEEA